MRPILFCLHQSAQDSQVFDILGEVFALRGLEDHRDFLEPPVIDDIAKAVQPDEPLADVFMAVTSGTKLLLTVIDVDDSQTVKADDLVE